MSTGSLAALHAELIDCRQCPRLVEWREKIATEKRASFKGQDYWGRPVPGLGDPNAQIVLVGLAPAAHGANRTGRMFTGDRSGDWLFRALHRAGLANQPSATSADDGLKLLNAFVTSAVKCAPPDNKPTPAERDKCSGWLQAELDLLSNAAVYICLGGFGYQALWRHLAGGGVDLPKPRPKFGHGVEIELAELTIVCSYHPSQQNTFTGRLTEEMFDSVMNRAVQIAASA